MRETSESELLTTHRNSSDDIETGERLCSGIEHGRYLGFFGYYAPKKWPFGQFR